MNASDVPRQFQGSRYTRERYLEGWQDGRAGRPHAHAMHADEIIRNQGRAQYEAYSAGHEAGREVAAAEPGALARANGLLDQLQQTRLGSLNASQRSQLAARLRAVAAQIEAGNPPGEHASG
jgi:hypothetical protein